MFQILNETIRVATFRDAYESIPSASERAAMARRQADALAHAARALEQEEARRQAKARARAELKARAREAAAYRDDAARARRPASPFGRRLLRLSFGA
ncbi:hypothetical protein [Albimonas pacifica]|uniref:Uncharacterized protein n=1 Tax=Albimonas pacifica TaxID=1114924 RepID=A0A1I3F4C4_9RHOB|nr:hypothetical protein [Albimonas pacifica]SFI06054.1 hypothetical protein SAMN05216258_10459 [Albimonas pacifica]